MANECSLTLLTVEWSPSIKSVNPNSPKKGEFRANVARRTRRAASGPVKHFANLKIEDSESNADTEDNSATRNKDSNSSCSGEQSSDTGGSRKSVIAYSSPDVQIHETPFSSLDDFPYLTRGYYAPEPNPASFAKSFRKRPKQQVLHADFDQGELSAVLELLAYFGFRWSFCSDIPLADQVIRAVASISNLNALALAVNGITWICELSRLLTKYRVDNPKSFLLAIMNSDDNSGKRGRVKDLINSIVGLDVRDNRRSLPQCVWSERFHQLLTSLTHASIPKRRYRADIQAFFTDAINRRLATVPRLFWGVLTMDEIALPQRPAHRSTTIDRLLRGRELGNRVNQRVQAGVSRNLRPSASWKGASNDVIVLAWSPDGTRFAVGATAQCDEHNMEYNRGNNLLLGDLTRNRLKELPDHWKPRSSQRAMSDQAGTSPRLFMSVTALQWFEDTLFTASYDNTVKLWDVSSHDEAYCFKTLKHQSKVQVMARSNFNQNIVATGADSIGYWDTSADYPKYTTLDINRVKRDVGLVPTSISWGTNAATSGLLVAGMAEDDLEDTMVPSGGHLGLWCANESSLIPIQLTPNSQNVFDIKWHHSLPAFATASSVPHSKTPGTSKEAKSVVRIYEPLVSKRCNVEFDCPALDINDVTFCPQNPNYVTASCTDGVTYVWDYRNPSDVLLKLEHGAPLNQIDENLAREQADAGVGLALWGDTIDQFYTGSSDGFLKLWNILRSQEDALVEDKANLSEGIMSGSFSEDKSNLLIGDAAGGIHVMSSGPFVTDDGHQMDFEPAAESHADNDGDSQGTESGVEASNQMLSSGRLVRHPIYGVGQGPFYDGPYAAWARPKGTPKEALPWTPLEQKHQARQFHGAPIEDRKDLDKQSRNDVAAHMRLASIRNQKRNENKRKRDDVGPKLQEATRGSGEREYIDVENYTPQFRPPMPIPKRRIYRPVITRKETDVIDLTIDSEPEQEDSENEVSAEEDPDEDEPWMEDFWWPANADVDANLHDLDYY